MHWGDSFIYQRYCSAASTTTTCSSTAPSTLTSKKTQITELVTVLAKVTSAIVVLFKYDRKHHNKWQSCFISQHQK